jgi:hypothetical protein
MHSGSLILEVISYSPGQTKENHKNMYQICLTLIFNLHEGDNYPHTFSEQDYHN